jgi:ribonucleoside-diphosphate reductase alpha chain
MISPEAQRLLEQRYLQRGENWEGLVTRVVNNVCRDEDDQYQLDVFNQIHNMIWLPNSPCLVGSGTKNGGLMACFVVGPEEDTIEDHSDTLGEIARVGKRGGGCGFSGSFVRPEDWHVAGSAHGKAYGPNKWAESVSSYLKMITQGNFREMALMYSLSTDNLWQEEPDHKFRTDIDDFINLKQQVPEGKLYNFNQSLFASDDWMSAAVSDPDSLQGRQLAKLAYNAWNNGEPGLLFADTINNNTPYQECGCKIYTTNPCGEQPLPPYGSCNLGSINISHDHFFDGDDFNFDKLAFVVMDATRFLDNVGSVNTFPGERFKSWYEAHRPIGIGIMGYADALMRMGMAYGESESQEFVRQVMNTIQYESYNESRELGFERGFPEHAGKLGRRNITTVSIAPTGSIAFIAGCSHGIEPVFSPVYQRTDERGETYLFEHPMRDEDFFRSSINDTKAKMPTWTNHIDIQVAAQSKTDSAVSKTINMVNGSTPDDVLNVFVELWKKRAKGGTIYRDGSREYQVLETLKEKDSAVISCPSGVCEV